MTNRREFLQTTTGATALLMAGNSSATTKKKSSTSIATFAGESYFGLVIEPGDPCLPVLQTAARNASNIVKDIVDLDYSESARYQFYRSVYDPQSMQIDSRASYRQTDGVSLFNHSGLPRIYDYGRLARSFAETEQSPRSFPNIGFKEYWKARILWQGPFWRVREDYFWQTNYLARLDRADAPWQTNVSQKWFSEMQRPLLAYMTEFFSGRFKDRNGKVKKFEWKLDLSSLIDLDQLRVSPELAGAIASVFVEFLCDVAFRVPYHAPKLSKTYRDYRLYGASSTSPLQATKENLQRIENAISRGYLIDSDFEKLSLTFDPDIGRNLNWSNITNHTGSQSTILANPLARMIAKKVQELDVDLRQQIPKLDKLTKEVEKIESGDSVLQDAFTCKRAGVIPLQLKCLFIKGEGECGKDNDTGSVAANKLDYAPLVGKIIETSSTAAEKSVKSALGGAIRGLSIASLDNEVLAEIIGSAGATLARKITEKTVYEVFVRFLDSDELDAGQKRSVLEKWEAIHKALKPENE